MIIPFTDTTKTVEAILDGVSFKAYVVQRNYGLNPEQVMKLGLNHWSKEQFAAAEAEYQEEMR